MAQRRLSKMFLSRLVQSRQTNLPDTAFPTLQVASALTKPSNSVIQMQQFHPCAGSISRQDLETYSEHTHATLLYLLMEAIQVRSVHADHAASHVVCSSMPY
jgi:hypothetical protein